MNDFKIIDNITSNLSVRIIHSFQVSHDGGWKEQRSKSEYTLWNIVRGRVWLTINGEEHAADPGDVVFFYPGNRYAARTEQDGCAFLYNRFSVEMGNGIDILSSINLAGIISAELIGEKCKQFCRDFMDKYQTPQRSSFQLYAVFISYLSSLIDAGRDRRFVPFYSETKVLAATGLRLVIDHVNEHFTEELPVSLLASMAGMSEKYFISCFNNMMGISPKKYIIQCRMRLAAELIVRDNMKVRDVAGLTGYGDPYIFSKAFSKYYEESPAVFRSHFISAAGTKRKSLLKK